MRKGLPLSCFVKSTLVVVSLFLSASSWADEPTSPSYKGESSPPRQLYKGEAEASDYASSVVSSEAVYGGEIYNSNLYQGSIRGPGYSPRSSHSLHDGYYVGLAAGYDSYNMRNSINTVSGGVAVFQQNPDLNAVGLTYGGVAGYGRVFDSPLYLGAELFYNTTQANTSQSIDFFDGTGTGSYYLKSVILSSYGFSFLPGIKLTDSVLVYLRGGYSRVDFKTYESSAALGVNNAQSAGVNGFNYGLGMEATLYKNWSVRGEYTHMNGQSVGLQTGTQVTPTDNQAIVSHYK